MAISTKSNACIDFSDSDPGNTKPPAGFPRDPSIVVLLNVLRGVMLSPDQTLCPPTSFYLAKIIVQRITKSIQWNDRVNGKGLKVSPRVQTEERDGRGGAGVLEQRKAVVREETTWEISMSEDDVGSRIVLSLIPAAGLSESMPKISLDAEIERLRTVKIPFCPKNRLLTPPTRLRSLVGGRKTITFVQKRPNTLANRDSMAHVHRSLESNRSEILLVAAGVFVLVSVLGIFIFIGAGQRAPRRTRDAENGQRSTAWGLNYRAEHSRVPDESYHDCDNSFINSVHRRSQCLAEEFKLELSNLRRNFSTLIASSADRYNPGIITTVRRFSIENMLTFSPSSSEPATDCESCNEYLDSPLSATGREEATGPRRRTSRVMGNVAACDLEAQHRDEPLAAADSG
ncbi:hypothetical protein FZEAL_4339 [Fusarium zealandicum]|uniref:Uncharacterized protein n=1 Tax=Fusarium zealandicum TaxID=1053134 RepID=A0A8H4ULY2_9HYPO|nr:hypothetical protein FZEAL_4339 [Fusarium zealandicum]